MWRSKEFLVYACVDGTYIYTARGIRNVTTLLPFTFFFPHKRFFLKRMVSFPLKLITYKNLLKIFLIEHLYWFVSMLDCNLYLKKNYKLIMEICMKDCAAR